MGVVAGETAEGGGAVQESKAMPPAFVTVILRTFRIGVSLGGSSPGQRLRREGLAKGHEAIPLWFAQEGWEALARREVRLEFTNYRAS